MSFKVSDFPIGSYYDSLGYVPAYPLNHGANVLMSSDNQVTLLKRMMEKIKGNEDMEVEWISKTITELDKNLNGDNEKINYRKIFERVQTDEWVNPSSLVKVRSEYSNPEKGQIHIRTWHLGAINEKEYRVALEQFKNNMDVLERDLNFLKKLKKVTEDNICKIREKHGILLSSKNQLRFNFLNMP